jgi:hypothetical protein
VGLPSLLVASGAVLVFKPLPSIKIWYAFGVLSKKKKLKHKPDATIDRYRALPMSNGFKQHHGINYDYIFQFSCQANNRLCSFLSRR